MSADLIRLCDPDAHYDRFLNRGIFPDGRSIGSFPAISFKNEGYGGVGSAIVQQGGITVCAVVSAEICLQGDGPRMIPKFEPSADTNENTANEVLDTLNELLELEGFIPRSALVCKGTEDSVPLSWRLTVTVRALNNGGSLMNAVVGAVTCALSSVKLPHIKLAHAKDDEAPIEKSEISVLAEKSQLELSDIPVCATFGVYQTSTLSKENILVLADPPTEILTRCSTTCTVIAGNNRILNLKLRGLVADSRLLNDIFDMAIGHQRAVAKSI